MTCSTSLVVIHKGIEVVVVRVSPTVSTSSHWLGKQINWAVIDHMSWGIASSTDLKIADIVGMSPLKTETTLGHQTIMCCVTRCHFPTGRTGVHGAEEAMMTEI